MRSAAQAEEIAKLLRETDAVAEVHDPVRAGVEVQLMLQQPSALGPP